MPYILHGFPVMQNKGQIARCYNSLHTLSYFRNILLCLSPLQSIKIDLYQFLNNALISMNYIINILLAIKLIGTARPQRKNPVLYLVP